MNTQNSYDGYTLFSPRFTVDTYLINNCGEIINQWTSNFQNTGGEFLMEDGSIYTSNLERNSSLLLNGVSGRIEKKDWDNNLLWEFSYSDTDYTLHHDYYPLSNGNILMLVAHRMTETEALESGRNPSLLPQEELYDERIIEVQPIGLDQGIIVWEWRLWDHLIQDFDTSKENFGVVSDHPELLNINYLGDSEAIADWLHINALDYNENLDQIIISSRHLNEFYIIDHSTTTTEAASSVGGNIGKGGDFLYRWGNPEAYNQGSTSDKKADGQHNVNWIPEGFPDANKIMFFNNGRNRTYSSVEIINPPINENGDYEYIPNTAYGPTESEWIYTDPENPDNFYSSFISGAYRLSNGNTLITNGAVGEIFEINSSATIVWKYINPLPFNDEAISQGETHTGTPLTFFRSKRYSPDYSAFSNKDLSPVGFIESNPIPENCELFNILSTEQYDRLPAVSISPNPVNDIMYINNNKNKTLQLEIRGLHGQKFPIQLINNWVDVSHLNTGIYIVLITFNDKTLTKKIIKT
ncbi:aryl-sulfate sulfotransferase [Aquimarina addita]|uniref:Aryl-sulfate sulfotransferase n=1 Tax=Aquimarina addita TaxID=870485 RepID=A0ABP7XER1_9FLAO